MNFEISEEHQMLRDAVADAVARVEATPAALWPVFRELGLTGICASEAAGGVGMDALALAIVAEEVAYVHPGMATVFVLHNASVCAALESALQDESIANLLGELLVGDRVGTGTVCSAGARLALWMGNVPHVALDSVSGSGTTSVVQITQDAVSETASFEGLAWASVSGSSSQLTVPGEHRSLPPLVSMGLGAVGVGIGRAAFDAAAAYSIERKQFGKQLSQFQAIQWMLSDSNAELDASRLLVRGAANAIDLAEEGTISEQSAYHAAETAMKIADRAIQIHGGYGYTREYPVERLWRDARQLLVGCLNDGRSLRVRVAEGTIEEAR